MEQDISRIVKQTGEVDIEVVYNKKDCSIEIKGKADLSHHLIEEIILLLAREFDMEDHLGIVWTTIKVRHDEYKEIKYARSQARIKERKG